MSSVRVGVRVRVRVRVGVRVRVELGLGCRCSNRLHPLFGHKARDTRPDMTFDLFDVEIFYVALHGGCIIKHVKT